MVETDIIANELFKIKLGSENYDESLSKAEEFKSQGNKSVKESKFVEAIDFFSKAIEVGVETKKNAIYYSNRAFMHIKMENLGLALSDADKAISIDKDYIKAYYRRASSNLLLRKYDEAISDLTFLIKTFPDDQDLRLKLDNSRKERKKKLFLESIHDEVDRTNKVSALRKFDKVKVETTYSGLTFPDPDKAPKEEFEKTVNKEWAEQIMNDMKDNKFIHSKYLSYMIAYCQKYFTEQKSVVDINYTDNKFNVCGDVHGQFYDLLNIFKINGLPSEANPYLFNGDFVDRGSFSVEVIVTLLAWKCVYPKYFFMARGNHETKNLNKMYGFEGEVKAKYNLDLYDCFCDLFCTLPLGHVLNNKIFITHGGLFSKDNVKLDDLKKIDRIREPPETGLMCEMLWADPCKEKGRHPSKRGVGLSFGPDVTHNFLDYNDLYTVVRSHEVKQDGYEVEADGRLITIFSAPNYCDQMGNKGALIKFDPKDLKKPEFLQFDSVPHPNVKPMQYSNPWMMF